MRGSVRIVVVTMALAVVASACSSSSSSGGDTSSGATGTQGGTFSVANCEPATSLIPSNNYEGCGTQVFEVLWEPLMAFDENNNLIPDQADSVTPSSDGLTYTIKLKSGWTFHDGTPVDAQSFVDAWNYTANPANAQDGGSYLSRIAGFKELQDGAAQELSGLKVVDDLTFTVQLSAPFRPFPAVVGYSSFDPRPDAFFKAPNAFGTHPIGNGPFQAGGDYVPGQGITLTRYDDYAGE